MWFGNNLIRVGLSQKGRSYCTYRQAIGLSNFWFFNGGAGRAPAQWSWMRFWMSRRGTALRSTRYPRWRKFEPGRLKRTKRGRIRITSTRSVVTNWVGPPANSKTQREIIWVSKRLAGRLPYCYRSWFCIVPLLFYTVLHWVPFAWPLRANQRINPPIFLWIRRLWVAVLSSQLRMRFRIQYRVPTRIVGWRNHWDSKRVAGWGHNQWGTGGWKGKGMWCR